MVRTIENHFQEKGSIFFHISSKIWTKFDPKLTGQEGAQTTTRDDPRDGKSSQSQTTFKILLLFNMLSAFLNGVNDCDETFNYWEPMHYLLYGKKNVAFEELGEKALRLCNLAENFNLEH